MAPLSTTLSLLLLAAASATVNAHFTLTTPASIGFVDDTESTGPCGGVAPNFASNTVTDFHVGGQPVGMKLGHPQASWLFRATLDQTGGANWTQLFPLVLQSSIGQFCEVAVPAPPAWVGRKGLLGVVAKAEDGLLYQCAAVTFVSGTGTAGSDCKNSSSEASFTSDSDLSALASMDGWTSTPASTNTSGTTSSTTTTSSTSSPTNAAAVLVPEVISLNSMMMVLAMCAMGAAYVL